MNIEHEPRRPSDSLLMLILRHDDALPHEQIPLAMRVYCETLIFSGEALMIDGVWSLTEFGQSRADYLWSQE